MKITRRDFAKLARWFEDGLRDAVTANPHAVSPSTPDVQCDTGPHPYTDWAYERGRTLGEMILADERAASGPETNGGGA